MRIPVLLVMVLNALIVDARNLHRQLAMVYAKIRAMLVAPAVNQLTLLYGLKKKIPELAILAAVPELAMLVDVPVGCLEPVNVGVLKKWILVLREYVAI
jgi:hypothetical protein